MGLLPYKDYQTHVLFPINSAALPGKPQSPAPLFPGWVFVFLNVPFGPLDYHVFDFYRASVHTAVWVLWPFYFPVNRIPPRQPCQGL